VARVTGQAEKTVQIETRRTDLADLRVVEHEQRPLGDGEVRMKVQRFGFSANNITYATMGEDMGYWRFFPAGEGWGVTPVWGRAVVTESMNPQVAVGSRYFGYYPLATDLVVRPIKVSDSGFMDGSPHRLELPPVYQRYTRVVDAESADIAAEDQDSLWRPLFVTSFGAADFLTDSEMFGAATSCIGRFLGPTGWYMRIAWFIITPAVAFVNQTEDQKNDKSRL